MRADVVIIGAGPAGGSAARLLSTAGLRVHLVEMRRSVGRPVQCGEALSNLALRENEVRGEDWILHDVKGIGVHSPHQEVAYVPAPGHCIDRCAFDRHLVDEALASGAVISVSCQAQHVDTSGDECVVHTTRGRLRSDYVIAADGPRSLTARSLGLLGPTEFNLGLQYKLPSELVDVPQDWLHLYLRRSYRGGYSWIFPRGHEVSVGVDVPRDARGHLQAFCRSSGIDISLRRESNGGLIPAGQPLRHLGTGKVMIVGDAAGATNPIFGGGIHAALSTGRWAGEAILKAWNDDDGKALEVYERRALSSPFFHPVLSFISQRLASVSDEVLSLAVQAYRDRRDPVKLLRILPQLLSQPVMLSKFFDMPRLRKALQISIKYGW